VEESVFLSNFNPAVSVDLEKLVALLLPDISDAVRWACLRYQGGVREDEIDDLSQQIILKLIEDDCRRLRLFNHTFSFKTWLQSVVDHHVYKCLYRRKQAENIDEVDPGALTYSSPQDRDIYADEQRKLLLRALGRLSEQERLLYHLCFVFEQDTRNVAAVFNIKVKNVYKRREKLVLKLTSLVKTFQNH
jgi:RNA polymerase sigma factor (sigma-70 family)